MKCIKCGNENNEKDNFCSKCGEKLDNSIEKSSKIPTLSWISLGFACMQVFSFLCQFSLRIKLLLLFEFPYVIVSLILAIISRILIIVDSIIIILTIVFLIVVAIFISNLINACSNPNSEMNTYLYNYIENVGGATN